MKISERWLREWVNTSLTREQLADALTMAGLEVEAIEAIHDASTGNKDYIFEISITPNRGDCLNVLGLSQEIAAITQSVSQKIPLVKIHAEISDVLSINIQQPESCPRYAGRIIRKVKPDAITPPWMQERLRGSGLNSINAIVDVMNYVMLELGQPMHAFDLAKISGGITVRLAKNEETLELLDGQKVQLSQNTLVIADQHLPIAIAGVMGGLDSGVTLLTQDVFLESAFFSPNIVARTVRHFNVGSDSSYRFERGIDPLLAQQAIERATQLIMEIAGGKPGPVIDVVHEQYLPTSKMIHLRSRKIHEKLGIEIPAAVVSEILHALQFSCEGMAESWNVTVPARRFDITTEIDLIEEIARLHGYNKIPSNIAFASLQCAPRNEKEVSMNLLRRAFCDLGYQEVVTYSFVSKKLQSMLNPALESVALINPITQDMEVMRTSLWSGLMNTFLYNQNRQYNRMRLFETGLRFVVRKDALLQEEMLSGLLSGDAYPEQWGKPARAVDFFDVKGDLENIFKLTFSSDDFEFRVGENPALHPGQTAEIYREGEYIGVLGAIHPKIAQNLDLKSPVFLFELVLKQLKKAKLPAVTEVSKFPAIRRDLSILINRAVPASQIQDTIKEVAGELLQDVYLFDLYQGKGIDPEHKSLALALILQHSDRTLVDEEVAACVDRVVTELKKRFAAELRG